MTPTHDKGREARGDEIELSPQQIQRLRSALLNVGPNSRVVISKHPKGIVVSTVDSRQRWHIGPLGGSF